MTIGLRPRKGLDDTTYLLLDEVALRREVRRALGLLQDPAALQRHPLARLLARESAVGASTAGRALRQRLLAAIDALRPDPSTRSTARAWRDYHLLSLRYVEGLDVAEVCARLGISESEYHRSHNRTLDGLVALVQDPGWLDLSGRKSSPVGLEATSRTSDQVRPALLAHGKLPHSLTSFVGRHDEVGAVRRLLASARLLVLTGPPGAGKSRLALEIAEAAADDFPDGVFYVPLAPITDPRLVVPTIAQVLHIPLLGNRSLLENMVEVLRERAVLLVLDNFEQVAAAVSVVAGILALCHRLTVLVSSRQALRVYGAQEFPVPPLALPDAKRLLAVEELAQNEAVCLFVERARALKPSFALTDENAADVAAICCRLDGLPLAIELAAAHSKILTPRAMLARLLGTGGRAALDLLVGEAWDGEARHRTLRSAIGWSVDLLPTSDQTIFRRLAVFAGGASLDAAEAVVGGWASESALAIAGQMAEGGRATALPVSHGVAAERPSTLTLDRLAALADNGLIQYEAEAEGEPRFRMLETVREYGRECLAATGEEEPLRRRHAEYYRSMAERMESRLLGPDRGASMAWLEQEHENLQAARLWFMEQGDDGSALRLALALRRAQGDAALSTTAPCRNFEQVARYPNRILRPERA